MARSVKSGPRAIPAQNKICGSFITKDTGKREAFSTGSQRDTQDGKPRYDLIPVGPMRRLAELYSRGAVKYGEDNWVRGQPLSRTYASLLRHVFAWREGDTIEDHLAGVVFNAFALMFFQDRIAAGRLPSSLDDLFAVEAQPCDTST